MTPAERRKAFEDAKAGLPPDFAALIAQALQSGSIKLSVVQARFGNADDARIKKLTRLLSRFDITISPNGGAARSSQLGARKEATSCQYRTESITVATRSADFTNAAQYDRFVRLEAALGRLLRQANAVCRIRKELALRLRAYAVGSKPVALSPRATSDPTAVGPVIWLDTLTVLLNSLRTEGFSPDTMRCLAEHEEAVRDLLNEIMVVNDRLVRSIANMSQNSGLEFDDLLQEGRIGQRKAALTFEYRRGFRYSTLAELVIRQTINAAIRRHARLIRLPEGVQKEIALVVQTGMQLEQKLCRRPDVEEIAHQLHMTTRRVKDLLKWYETTLSIDRPVQLEDGEEDLDILSSIEDTQTVDNASQIRQTQLRSKLEVVLKTLTHRQERVIRLHFGLIEGADPKTLEEIGALFNVSRERIRQNRDKALRRLQHPSRRQALRDCQTFLSV